MMTRPSDVIVRFKNNPKLMFKYFNEKVGVQCALPFNGLHAGEGEDRRQTRQLAARAAA